MAKKLTKVFSLVLAIMMTVSCVCVFAACDENKTYYDNETDKLIFSTLELDKVFNPFFSTSGTDSNIVGMTQIGMIANDEKGDPVWGDGEAVVAKDVEIVSNGGEQGKDLQTTYYFVLKNNVKFSNGSPLTIKDVLFNLYVYLDPAYTGSSTIYSTDIVGLKKYRTQSEDEDEQKEFETKYKILAQARIDALIEASSQIVKEHPEVDVTEMESYLKNDWETIPSNSYKHLVKDFQKTRSLFLEELKSDYSNSRDSYKEQVFTDKDGKVYKDLFTTDVEMFLYNEGYISWNKNEGKLYSSFVTSDEDWADLRTWSEEKAIDLVYNAKMPTALEEILQYWATAIQLYDFLTKEEMENDNKEVKFPNIEGIKFANREEDVTVNGNLYKKLTDADYNEDGSVKDGKNEVLSITINDIDPKAIWNFAFAIAPMYYYSDEAHIRDFDYETHFGVERGSQTFMETVVKNPDKIGVPVGAGPYAASKSSGGLENVKAGDFYDKGVIYYERNPYFIGGPAKIKNVRFQVVSSNGMLDALYTNMVNFAEPNAKPETQDELKKKKEDGLDYKTLPTMGYGYIGVNAGKVPNVYVRRAIMYAIDTSMTVQYYQNLAKPIYRSMSKESWAYPEGCTAYYPFIGDPIPENLDVVDEAYATYVSVINNFPAGYTMSELEQLNFIKYLMEERAGYTLSGNGIYADNGKNECKFEFTIAGQETDHPAYGAMYKASQILNKVGFNVTVRTDKDALSKLSTGSLTVWAAAWGSTIDPDMYQVYHEDSTATSVLNWGYKQIALNPIKYAFEADKIGTLSGLIEEARETNDQTQRKQKYSEALDLVMELAIELPTYQRQDMFAYNANMIDASTFYQGANCFKGLTSDMHTISLVVEK